MSSSIIPYLNILYPHMGPPTTPGPQAPHHLNPALLDGCRHFGVALQTDAEQKSLSWIRKDYGNRGAVSF